MGEAVLEVDDLSTHIQLSHSVVQAVGNVSLRLAAGETLGLVGESGSGKSMIGLSILGLLPPGGKVVGGSVRLLGRELTSLAEAELRQIRGNEIAMIFQDSQSALNPTMPIGEQVAEPFALHRGATKREALERAAEVLDLVGIARPKERLGEYPHQLSGGLRQRVMIAMALACEPKVLIADEPTTALDVTIQAQILRLLDDLKERLGMAVLLITHDMGVVAGRADRVDVMYAGRIVETSATAELFAGMRHPYTQALLASIPRLDQDTGKALFSIPGIPPNLAHPPDGCRFRARCTYAADECATAEPPLAAGGSDGEHLAACFHPLVHGPLTPEQLQTVVQQRRAPAPAAGPEVNGAVPLLQVSDVVKEFPVTAGSVLRRRIGAVHAVSGISLTVGSGEILGLVGESGCGKSTLGRIVVGLEEPDAGQVLLGGEDVFARKGRDLARRRRDLQMMFQDPYGSLDPRMRVEAILMEPLAIHHTGSKRQRDARIRELLVEVGLPLDSLERFPHEFSGGQRQRIGLARALMLNPKVIVADEPVSALDVSIRSQVLNLMKRLQANHDMAYIVISHDLAVVKYLADRIGVMYLGKLVEQAPGPVIYSHPAHPYTEGLIKTIPVPDPAAEGAKSEAAIRGELPSPVDPPSGCRFRTRCPRAEERCATEEPPLRTFGPGHVAACHFPLIEPAGDQPVALTATRA